MIATTKNMRVILLLLAGVLASGPPAEAAGVKNDWSQVRKVQPGMRIWVRLYKNEAPKGQPQVVRGRFASASADGVTLMLSDGNSATFEKRAVRRVSVRRPASQRWPAGVAAGSMAAVNLALIRGADSEDASATLGILTLVTTVPVWAAVHFGMARKPIYDVPAESGNN